MFSTGQWIFAGLFLVVFTGVIIYSYRKDKQLHERNYQGVIWIGIVFIVFLFLLFILKYLLKN